MPMTIQPGRPLLNKAVIAQMFTMVSGKDNKRIVGKTTFIQVTQDTTHLIVHVGDKRIVISFDFAPVLVGQIHAIPGHIGILILVHLN